MNQHPHQKVLAATGHGVLAFFLVVLSLAIGMLINF